MTAVLPFLTRRPQTKRELAERMGIPERSVEEMVRLARLDGAPILSDGDGYRLAADPDELEAQATAPHPGRPPVPDGPRGAPVRPSHEGRARRPAAAVRDAVGTAMTERRLAIVEKRGERWVPTQLVGGAIADTLLEMIAEGAPECLDERCAYAGTRHHHDDSGTWVER